MKAVVIRVVGNFVVTFIESKCDFFEFNDNFKVNVEMSQVY